MNDPELSSKPKSLHRRFWYLSTFLVLMLVFGIYHLFRTLLDVFYLTVLHKPFNVMMAAYFVTSFAATCIFAIALLRFKKWGLYGLFSVMVAGMVTTVVWDLNRSYIGSSLLGFVLLVTFLSIGKDKCAWRQCT